MRIFIGRVISRKLIILFAPLALLLNLNIASAQQTSLCADPDQFLPDLASDQSDPAEAVNQRRPGKLSADEIWMLDQGFIQATGDVIIEHPNFLMETESITIDQQDESFQVDEMKFKVFNVDNEDSQERQLLIRGIADSVSLESGVFQFMKAEFTNCPEGNRDVVLSSPDIQLDANTGFGRARKATLKFKNVPIFYFPVLIFPILDERLSGFLFPKLGFNRASGLAVHIPYYFNLAPNADATVSTNVYSNRGVQLQTEFRHAGRHSDTVIEAEFLSRDRAWSGTGSRKAANIESNWHDKKRFYSSLDAEWVSDTEYFLDFDSVFEDRESYYLNQSAQFNFVGTDYRASIGFDKFSVSSSAITKDQLPPSRLPWMTVEQNFELTDQTGWNTIVSLDEFRHTTDPSGRRVRVDSFVEHQQQLDFLLIKHKLGGEFIDSRVREENNHSAQKASISGLHYSLDASMALDEITSSESGGRWTLEPRVKLTFADDKDQSQVPNFNTTLPNLYKYSQIYRDTFYSGGDRLTATKQASLGMSFSYANPMYPSDINRIHLARIAFPGADENNAESLELKEKYSGYFLGAEVERTDWGVDSGILFNHDTGKMNQATAGMSFQMTPKTKVQSFYKYLHEDDEQIEGILESNLSPFWSMMLRHATSLDDSPLKKSEIFFEHQSCCWSASLSLKRKVNELGVSDDSINLNFELLTFSPK